LERLIIILDSVKWSRKLKEVGKTSKRIIPPLIF
jgi:hypothetical protein